MTIYKPAENSNESLKSTYGVKFSNDTFILESFLIQRGIEYKEEDLELTPFGKALRIKREKNEH